jgi:hypothetical protein
MSARANTIKKVVLKLANEHLEFLRGWTDKERAAGTNESELWHAVEELNLLPHKIKNIEKIEDPRFFIENFGGFLKKGDLPLKEPYSGYIATYCASVIMNCDLI